MHNQEKNDTRLSKIMNEKNLDSKTLSQISKVYEESIQQIMSGQRPISSGEAKKIAKALHCSEKDLTNRH